jgi:type II secretory pathway pseudopilin PulG
MIHLLMRNIREQHKKNAGQSAGITLIEAIVSITIVTFALAGPITLASRSIKSSVASRNQFVASHMAEEGIEAVRAMISNNSADDPIANCTPVPNASCKMAWLNNFVWTRCGNGGNGCIIDISDQTGGGMFGNGFFTQCTAYCGTLPMAVMHYMPSTGLYRQNNVGAWSGWDTLPFRRWVVITRPNDTNNPPQDEIRVTAYVEYPGINGRTATTTVVEDIKNWFPNLSTY